MITSLYIVIALERKYRDYHWNLNFELMRSIGSNDISYWLVLFGITQKLNRSSHRRCSIKKLFLKISQNSQENTCPRVSFLIKLQSRPWLQKWLFTDALYTVLKYLRLEKLHDQVSKFLSKRLRDGYFLISFKRFLERLV